MEAVANFFRACPALLRSACHNPTGFGADLCAVMTGWRQIEGQIGNLLLVRSGLCRARLLPCAGLFAGNTCGRYLNGCLDRYLGYSEKFYDQHRAIAELLGIGEQRGISDSDRFLMPGEL